MGFRKGRIDGGSKAKVASYQFRIHQERGILLVRGYGYIRGYSLLPSFRVPWQIGSVAAVPFSLAIYHVRDHLRSDTEASTSKFLKLGTYAC